MNKTFWQSLFLNDYFTNLACIESSVTLIFYLIQCWWTYLESANYFGQNTAVLLWFFLLRNVSCIMLHLINPNTFTGLVWKVRKKLSPEEGRVEKKNVCCAPVGVGAPTQDLPRARRGSTLHSCRSWGLFRQASLSMPIDRVGRLRNTTCCVFWR